MFLVLEFHRLDQSFVSTRRALQRKLNGTIKAFKIFTGRINDYLAQKFKCVFTVANFKMLKSCKRCSSSRPGFRSPCCSSGWNTTNVHAPNHAPQPPLSSRKYSDSPTAETPAKLMSGFPRKRSLTWTTSNVKTTTIGECKISILVWNYHCKPQKSWFEWAFPPKNFMEHYLDVKRLMKKHTTRTNYGILWQYKMPWRTEGTTRSSRQTVPSHVERLKFLILLTMFKIRWIIRHLLNYATRKFEGIVY